MASGLDFISKSAIFFRAHPILSQTTLDMLCLFISETTLPCALLHRRVQLGFLLKGTPLKGKQQSWRKTELYPRQNACCAVKPLSF